ncbi:hypothetical protein UFOVP1382_57 [uncultured Caudovirales phage]|uniref:Uncharacterized protein n=1 Tax=uncultured Caudovirales phage TaxID=2100421 RepID=A0A6J5RXH0_9CAUD|nr:hypothetical protein UFOVP1382_57 [uncultured Caudovirales phage]
MSVLHDLAESLTSPAAPPAPKPVATQDNVSEAVEPHGDPNVSFYMIAWNAGRVFAGDIAAMCLRFATRATPLQSKGEIVVHGQTTSGYVVIRREPLLTFNVEVTPNPQRAIPTSFKVRAFFTDDGKEEDTFNAKAFTSDETPSSIAAVAVGSDEHNRIHALVGGKTESSGPVREEVLGEAVLIRGSTSVDIAYTIANQLGGSDGAEQRGLGRLIMMLGITKANLYAMNPLKQEADKPGLSFQWPNRTPTKGNFCVIELMPSDEYEVRFYNVRGEAKLVKTFTRVYAEDLRDIFEKQTGWYTKL